jgi:hypothetical protein
VRTGPDAVQKATGDAIMARYLRLMAGACPYHVAGATITQDNFSVPGNLEVLTGQELK